MRGKISEMNRRAARKESQSESIKATALFGGKIKREISHSSVKLFLISDSVSQKGKIPFKCRGLYRTRVLILHPFAALDDDDFFPLAADAGISLVTRIMNSPSVVRTASGRGCYTAVYTSASVHSTRSVY